MKRLASLTLVLGGIALSTSLVFAQAPATPTTPAAPTQQPATPIIITNGQTSPDGAKKNGAPTYLSSGLGDVVKMFQAGVEEQVLLAYIQSSTIAYHPSAKEIIYLRELGMSQNVITALLRRGGELRDRAADVEREERNRTPQPPAPTPANPPASANTATAPVQPTVVYTEPSYPTTYVASYPYYSYSYPYYYGGYYGCRYPYYGGYYGGCYRYGYPSIGISFGYGSGHYGHGHGGGIYYTGGGAHYNGGAHISGGVRFAGGAVAGGARVGMHR